jgi:hypothetical protein
VLRDLEVEGDRAAPVDPDGHGGRVHGRSLAAGNFDNRPIMSPGHQVDSKSRRKYV